MGESFRSLERIYLTSDGDLMENSIPIFLASFVSENINSLESRDLGKWIQQIYGSNAKWKFIEKMPLSGLSPDPVIEVILIDEIHFCKIFVDPKRALQEYLASLYIDGEEIPQWKHVPIIKMGKLVEQNGNQYVYFCTRKARGVKGSAYLERISGSDANLAPSESLFKTLGQILASQHKKETYVFPSQKTYSRLHFLSQHKLKNLPHHLIPIVLNDPIYREFQIAIEEFFKIYRNFHLRLGSSNFANFFYSSEAQVFEVFDQGSVLDFFAANGKCYHFREEAIASVLLNLTFVGNLLKVPFDRIAYLQTKFLQSYYSDGFPAIDYFYQEIDVWIQYYLFGAFARGIGKADVELVDFSKREWTLYQNAPKAYLAKWFTT